MKNNQKKIKKQALLIRKLYLCTAILKRYIIVKARLTTISVFE
jgi:hypothetical protein